MHLIAYGLDPRSAWSEKSVHVALLLSQIRGQFVVFTSVLKKPFFEHAPTNFSQKQGLTGVKSRLFLTFSSHVAWQHF